MAQFVLVHYHEIALKRGNRAFFEHRLRQNLEQALEGVSHRGVRRISGRLIIELTPETDLDQLRRRLARIPGIAHWAIAQNVAREIETIEARLGEMTDAEQFSTFRVEARRADKLFALNSQQINQRVGAFIQQRSGKKVELTNPELTCHIDLVEKYVFLYFHKEKGVGGLPVGTGGRLLSLLSGGIDSPVASYRLIRRGCRVHFVHFHSFPFTTLDSQEKVRQLAQVLTSYQAQSSLYLVPFAAIQKEIVAYTPPPTRVILYRRFMMRLAEALAEREGIRALITGDSLGQVASQTVENLDAVSRAISMPVFRPLIGDDKDTIVQIARQIGTYEISILPDTDCCSLFVPQHPETRAALSDIATIESCLEIPRLIETTLSETRLEKISPNSSHTQNQQEALKQNAPPDI